MRFKSLFYPLFFVSIVLSSCEFRCSVGDQSAPERKASASNGPLLKDGATLYNDININAYKVKVNKAFLVFEGAGRVPEDNFVDFTKPVQVVVKFDSAWTAENGRAWIDASEKVQSENGTVVLDQESLFGQMTEGADANDAKTVTLTVTINRKGETFPTSYRIMFRIWDKKGEGYVEGSYKLYSK